MGNLIYCPCEREVGYSEILNEREAIRFNNVREVLFRPHISYVRRVKNKKQRVIFTERIENGQPSACEASSLPNMVIHPLTGFENETDTSPKPSTSNGSKIPVIRLAVSISKNTFDLNENCIFKYLEDAIIQDLNGKELGPMATVSLVSDPSLREKLSALSNSQAYDDSIQAFDLSELITFN